VAEVLVVDTILVLAETAERPILEAAAAVRLAERLVVLLNFVVLVVQAL
jgi:hypothetical protein